MATSTKAFITQEEPTIVPIPKRLLLEAVIIQERLTIYEEGCSTYPTGYF